jgi:hypothetical protein
MEISLGGMRGLGEERFGEGRRVVFLKRRRQKIAKFSGKFDGSCPECCGLRLKPFFQMASSADGNSMKSGSRTMRRWRKKKKLARHGLHTNLWRRCDEFEFDL